MPASWPRIPNVNLPKQQLDQLHYRSPVQLTASRLARYRLGTQTPLTHRSPPVTLSQPVSLFSRVHQSAIAKMETKILAVDAQKLGNITIKEDKEDLLDAWQIEYTEGQDYESFKRAAEELVNTDIPVAFPTETVYGLGADATRSSAVKAIFAAKGRPADNPLIVHIHSLPQLRALLSGQLGSSAGGTRSGTDPIPAIYKPLIERFWPGPLTIILPTPQNSVLAPEVTAGLSTFGARMPRSILALSLLRLCDRPLAAPSANASTRPSPTAAEHVYDDLNGRICTIIDGGPCEVGVESTVVDGLSSPPAILRPGGVTVEQLRRCPGWEHVIIGYKDKREGDASKPRAPGMKYRHYSPKAPVVLFEAGAGRPSMQEMVVKKKIGLIRTKSWNPALGLGIATPKSSQTNGHADFTGKPVNTTAVRTAPLRMSNLLRSVTQHQVPHAQQYTTTPEHPKIWDIDLIAETEVVARGLFSALRELDKKGVDVIYVEGIDDKMDDDIAAAVMNRLRKAAEIRA